MYMLMKNMDELLGKYWEGKTSIEEENQLKEHFKKEENSETESVYFNYLKNRKQEKLKSPDFDKHILNSLNEKQVSKISLSYIKYWQYAAAIIVLVTLSILLTVRLANIKDSANRSNEITFVDTYDDPHKAFEETKKALLLISTNLNKGQEYTEELVKFSETQEKLKK